VDIHNKLSKLNCLDEILAKLNNLEMRFSHMEQNVQGLAREVAKCKLSSDALEDTTNVIRADLAKTKDDLLELTTRTMRDNLVFFNIPEKPNEKPEDTEQIVYEFIENVMKVDSEITKNISFERVHRAGPIKKKKPSENSCKVQFSQREGSR
jgi:septation ring formation regulator EzrA